MPVYFRGGIGELPDNAIKCPTVEIISRETGWMYSKRICDIPPAKAFPAIKYDRQNVVRIARTIVAGELVPGMIKPCMNEGIFANDGKVFKRQDVHTLCGRRMKWSTNLTDISAKNAIVGGRNKNGENYYIGLVEFDGQHLIGRVDNGKLYVPYQERELKFDVFKLLVWGP